MNKQVAVISSHKERRRENADLSKSILSNHKAFKGKKSLCFFCLYELSDHLTLRKLSSFLSAADSQKRKKQQRSDYG